jgi:hypothetical protein
VNRSHDAPYRNTNLGGQATIYKLTVSESWGPGAYFYAGGGWSRSNRYGLFGRGGDWGITKFQNLMSVEVR